MKAGTKITSPILGDGVVVCETDLGCNFTHFATFKNSTHNIHHGQEHSKQHVKGRFVNFSVPDDYNYCTVVEVPKVSIWNSFKRLMIG